MIKRLPVFTWLAIQITAAGCAETVSTEVHSVQKIRGIDWPLLAGDINPDDSEAIAVGEVLLTNPRSFPAQVDLISKSCSCFQLSGLPETLESNQSVLLTIFAHPRPSSAVRSSSAVVQLSWADNFLHTVTIDQDVRVLPEFQMTPTALTFGSDCEQESKDFNLKLNYRSRRKLKVAVPHLFACPNFLSLREINEIHHKRVAHDIWEIVWNGNLTIDRSKVHAISQSVTSHQDDWVVWTFPDNGGSSSTVRVPITVLRDPEAVSAHPDYVYFDGSPKSVAIKVSNGKRFRSVILKEPQTAPFRFELVNKTSLQFLSIVGLDENDLLPGAYHCKLELLSEAASDDLNVEVVIPSKISAGK